jgi:predicted transcriptional regulator
VLLRSLQQASRMLKKIQPRGAAMAFWNTKKDDYQTMDKAIQAQPGISAAELARQLRLERSTVTRRLPSLEEAGFLYYEDNRGGLWPFGRKK